MTQFIYRRVSHLILLVFNTIAVQSLSVATGGKDSVLSEKGNARVLIIIASQRGCFAQTSPVVTSALDGFNICIFAYGQTGTGKLARLLQWKGLQMIEESIIGPWKSSFGYQRSEAIPCAMSYLLAC